MKFLSIRFSAFILTFFLITLSAKAQSNLNLGVKGGINFATMFGDTYSNLGLRTGFLIGVYAELPYNEKLSFQGDLTYSQEGARNTDYAFSTFSSVIYDQKIKYDYLNIPIAIKYHLTDQINIQGIYQMGFRLSAKEVRIIKDGTPSATDQSAGTRNLNGRIKFIYPSLGIGGEYSVNEKLNLQARFFFSIFDNVKRKAGDSEGTYPLILQLTASYLLKKD